MSVLGIDNGHTGALAVLSEVPGLPIVELIPLPVMRAVLAHRTISAQLAKGKVKKSKVKRHDVNEIDAVALKAILVGIGINKISAIFFEGCPDHANKAGTMKSMAHSDGKIMAVIELLGLHGITHRILSHTWQGPMLGKVPQGETKVYAERVARGLWPEQDWRRTPRCSTSDTGFIDASLIAAYGLRSMSRNLQHPNQTQP